MYALFKLIAFTAALSLTACASYYPNQYAATGAVIGGVTGALIGRDLDDDKGKYVGWITGAAIGAALGHNADQIHQIRRQSSYDRGYSDGGY